MGRRAKHSNAIGYVRMSTDRQDLSPHSQGAALDRWASREGIALVAIYFDLGVSGDADEESRPGLAEAIASIPRHRAAVLVASAEDRFSRNTDLAGYLSVMALRKGAELVSVDGSGDPFRRDIDRAFAAEELRRIRGRTRAALAAKRARGERVGGIPFGRRLKPDGAHRLVAGVPTCRSGCPGCLHLEPEPAEELVVARIRALRAEGLSVAAVTRKLVSEASVSRTGRPLGYTQVHRILRQAVTSP